MSLPPIVLYVNFYTDKSNDRQNELVYCQKMNADLDSIDKIYFIVDNLELYKQWTVDFPKIKLIYLGNRPMFTSFFQIANQTQHHPKQINIVSNTDIHFTSSLDLLKTFDWQNRALCLSRQDTNVAYSQDVWAWQGTMRNISTESNFCLGTPGCDNRIAQILYMCGYKLHNPSKTIIAHHVHNSMVRNYTEASRLHGDGIFVGPSYLGEESLLHFEQRGKSKQKSRSRSRSQSRGLSKVTSKPRSISKSKNSISIPRQSKPHIPLQRSQSVVVERNIPTHTNLKRNNSIIVTHKPTATTVQRNQQRRQLQRVPQRIIKRTVTLNRQQRRTKIATRRVIPSRRVISSRRVAVRTLRRK